MDGLGLCCFNKQEQRWEVAFLRFRRQGEYNEHYLAITVSERNFLGTEIYKKTYRVPQNVRELEFKVPNGSKAHYGVFKGGCINYDPLPFSRKGLSSNDFRWVIDYVGDEIPHGKLKRLKKKKDYPDRVDVTLLYIPHSLFYVGGVSRDAVRISPSKQDPQATHSFELGYTNEELGGTLFATVPVEFEIQDRGGIMNPIKQTYVPGNTYEVSITNLDYEKQRAKERESVRGYVLGDFHYYYDVIEVDGNPWYLWAPSRISPRAREGDCHMVRTTVDTLTPLLE
jgi:hypothetical protein